jgi:hypothetical protein
MMFPDEIGKVAEALKAIGLKSRFGYRPADEFIPRDTFFVAIDCDGVPAGEIRHTADTLEDALFGAIVRREDALAHQKLAA